ncbi:MAG: phosphonate metabolism transcriptional regulator PhnF [Acetobacteraceae bacterium]
MSNEGAPAPAVTLPRRDGVALWREIAERLRAEIAAGTPAPSARLPSEAELARRFGVNRHTLRRALEELARAGLIQIAQGRGSFVSEDVLDYTIGPRTRFSEWIRQHNKEPSGRMLQLAEVPAEPPVARGLGIAPGAPVILLERLGFADDRPVSLAAHHFPATLGPGLLDAFRTAPSITEALAAVGIADYRRAVTRVTARLPTAEEAALLRTSRTRPLLVSENVNVDGHGRVVEFGLTRYPTPRVQIVFEP